MRIAYILSSLANSGPIIVAYDLVQLMVKNGHEVEVFYFDNKIQLKFPCPVHQISLKHKFPFDRFDIVHCHGLRPDLYIYCASLFLVRSLYVRLSIVICLRITPINMVSFV